MLASVNKTWREIAYDCQVQQELFKPYFGDQFEKLYEFINEVETELAERSNIMVPDHEIEQRVNEVITRARQIKIYLIALERCGYAKCYEKTYNALKNLLQRTVDTTFSHGQSSLYLAAQQNLEKEAHLLVKHFGASLDTQDEFCLRAPLWWAAHEGYCSIVKFFVEAGANVNLADGDGSTPLYKAAQCGNFDIVIYLVENGADITKKGYLRQTPLETARSEATRCEENYPIFCSQENYPNLVKIIKFLEKKEHELN